MSQEVVNDRKKARLLWTHTEGYRGAFGIAILAMGLAYGLLSEKGLERANLLLMVGFLGGFTTFSTFSLDVMKLVSDERFLHALMYIFTSFLGAILAVWVGFLIAKGLSS